MADCTSKYDIDCELQNSPLIANMRAKDQQLQSQVDNIKDELDKNDPSDLEWRGIKQRLDDVEACCEDKQDQINQVNTVISEVGDNITLLKWMITGQEIKMRGLLRQVILDDKYMNFSDWIENVYIPQWESLENKYTQWDIYMNVNQKVWATNATYVCIRHIDSKKPLSANDWQELYYSAPADVIAILWIDPVEVLHPYKHEWVIQINPDKFADMISNLQSLDLSHVDVTLWDVYFNPIIKESVTIQENLTVWNTATVKTLEARNANIDQACITQMTCDTKFTWTPEFNDMIVKWTIDTHDIVADTATIESACINKMSCNTDFSDVIPEFNTANFNVQINTKRLNWEWAHIKKACIEEMVCDTNVSWITIWEWTAQQLTVNQFIQEWGTAVFNWPTEFNDNVILNTVEWDTIFNDVVNAPDINVINRITTKEITVNNTTELNWPVNINSYINYKDSEWRIVCVGNVIENLYRPSFGMFDIIWSGWAGTNNNSNNLLFWLWSDAVWQFNLAQWADAVTLIPLWWNQYWTNQTRLLWDYNYTSPWVELVPSGDTWAQIHFDEKNYAFYTSGWVIRINWWNWEDAWLYTIEFNMTIEFSDISDNTPMNIWSHRAWVVVFDSNNIQDWWYIIDDKTTAAEQLFKYTWSHHHSYYDSDSYSRSENRITWDTVFNIQQPDRCNPSSWWSDVVLRVWNHYTYTKTLTIPVNRNVLVAPYFKPSAWCEDRDLHLNFNIPTWKWNTGSKAQIFVHKVAPLYSKPYEYHC